MDHVVAAELVWAAARAQHPTLRFNFRGVGASQGERGGPGTWAEDVNAAESTLLERAQATRAWCTRVWGGGPTSCFIALGRQIPRGPWPGSV